MPTSPLTNIDWPIETTPATIQPSEEKVSPTLAPVSNFSTEVVDPDHNQLPIIDPPHKDTVNKDKDLQSNFETLIPDIQLTIKFGSARVADDEDLLVAMIHTFFLEFLASGPNSASFVSADLRVSVASSSPTEVFITGKTIYGRNDRPDTDDIETQLQTYFSYWGYDHLTDYLESDNLVIDQISIQLNGKLVSSQRREEEPTSMRESSSSENDDISIVSIVVSVVLIMIAITMFAFVIFVYRHFQQTSLAREDGMSHPKKEPRQPTYPSNIVLAFSGSSSTSQSKHEEAESMSYDPSIDSSHSHSVKSKGAHEEEYGRCSI